MLLSLQGIFHSFVWISLQVVIPLEWRTQRMRSEGLQGFHRLHHGWGVCLCGIESCAEREREREKGSTSQSTTEYVHVMYQTQEVTIYKWIHTKLQKKIWGKFGSWEAQGLVRKAAILAVSFTRLTLDENQAGKGLSMINCILIILNLWARTFSKLWSVGADGQRKQPPARQQLLRSKWMCNFTRVPCLSSAKNQGRACLQLFRRQMGRRIG